MLLFGLEADFKDAPSNAEFALVNRYAGKINFLFAYKKDGNLYWCHGNNSRVDVHTLLAIPIVSARTLEPPKYTLKQERLGELPSIGAEAMFCDVKGYFVGINKDILYYTTEIGSINIQTCHYTKMQPIYTQEEVELKKWLDQFTDENSNEDFIRGLTAAYNMIKE